MRTMIRFKFPVDPGNDLIRTGKLAKVFEQLTADLKPEAAYLYAESGERGGIMVFDMQDVSEVAGVVERFSFGLHAKVELMPVMKPEDLQKGLAGRRRNRQKLRVRPHLRPHRNNRHAVVADLQDRHGAVTTWPRRTIVLPNT